MEVVLMQNYSAFMSISGIIRSISDFSNGGCVKLFSLIKNDGTVTDFIVDSTTYFTENIPLRDLFAPPLSDVFFC